MAPSPYANASFPRRSLHHKREYEALITRIYTSGSPVAEDEICHIENAVLPVLNQDVASINGSIASLQSILDSMKEERAALALGSSNSCQASGPIWRLSQVCRTWRNVALSYYSAWCTIEFDFMERTSEDDAPILELVLQRSHQRPLSVTLTGCCCEPDSDLVRAPLKHLFAESHRWQSLNLTEFDPPSLYQSLRGRLPQLESLIFYYDGDDRPVLHIFNDCPCLTRVSLLGNRAHVDLPVAQLTELCLKEGEDECWWRVDDVGAYWHLIEECQSLQTLHISCLSDISDDEDYYSPLSMITHPNICKIDIDCMGLMDKLTLPRLQEAALAHDYNCRAVIYSLHQFEDFYIVRTAQEPSAP
ncbi:hypothetical protein BDZ89DRAFT_1179766 [Hymenopellis radicata]|nr:hypothetical protein BDZ89DRAFT_1179766 [Hymenopellis radicata]